MRRPRGGRTARGAFTLLEVVFAVVIVSTALLGLQATVSGSIRSAGTSINRRAAREVCRQKLEEVLAGTLSPDGGGDVDDRPNFTWSARTEEVPVGAGEQKTEVVKVVIVEVEFPVDTGGGGGGGGGAKDGPGAAGGGGAEDGREKLRLAALLPEPPPGQQAAPPPPR